MIRLGVSSLRPYSGGELAKKDGEDKKNWDRDKWCGEGSNKLEGLV